MSLRKLPENDIDNDNDSNPETIREQLVAALTQLPENHVSIDQHVINAFKDQVMLLVASLTTYGVTMKNLVEDTLCVQAVLQNPTVEAITTLYQRSKNHEMGKNRSQYGGGALAGGGVVTAGVAAYYGVATLAAATNPVIGLVGAAGFTLVGGVPGFCVMGDSAQKRGNLACIEQQIVDRAMKVFLQEKNYPLYALASLKIEIIDASSRKTNPNRDSTLTRCLDAINNEDTLYKIVKTLIAAHLSLDRDSVAENKIRTLILVFGKIMLADKQYNEYASSMIEFILNCAIKKDFISDTLQHKKRNSFLSILSTQLNIDSQLPITEHDEICTAIHNTIIKLRENGSSNSASELEKIHQKILDNPPELFQERRITQ